jgi:hypothetical protein
MFDGNCARAFETVCDADGMNSTIEKRFTLL